MSSGIQQEMNDVKYTQEDMDKEINGKRAVANHLNTTKFLLAQEEKKTQQLYNIIIKSNDFDMIEDMLLNTMGMKIPIKYYAIKSTYINKKGKKSKCWKSAYGKYSGKRNKKIVETDIPILRAYKYYTKEDFTITLMGKGNPAEIEFNDTYTIINSHKVQIVEDGISVDIDYDTEEE